VARRSVGEATARERVIVAPVSERELLMIKFSHVIVIRRVAYDRARCRLSVRTI